jgi:hypothetical protein
MGVGQQGDDRMVLTGRLDTLAARRRRTPQTGHLPAERSTLMARTT